MTNLLDQIGLIIDLLRDSFRCPPTPTLTHIGLASMVNSLPGFINDTCKQSRVHTNCCNLGRLLMKDVHSRVPGKVIKLIKLLNRCMH